MRIRIVLLGLAIFILATGLFLLASATVRETHTSSSSFGLSGTGSPQYFTFTGATLTRDNPPQIIVGSTGVAEMIVLNTPRSDFGNWICHCPGLIGGNGFNITILESYLQTHQSKIAYSQTIANQNVTLDYHVSTRTDVTLVIVHLGPGTSKDYLQVTATNQTLTYPILGYTERPGTFWTLSNISLSIIAAGAASLVVALISFKTVLPRIPNQYQGPAMQKCPGCGYENRFSAEKCVHCGTILRNNESLRVEAASHQN